MDENKINYHLMNEEDLSIKALIPNYPMFLHKIFTDLFLFPNAWELTNETILDKEMKDKEKKREE